MRHFITLASIISLSFLFACSSDDDKDDSLLTIDKTELLFTNQVEDETLILNITTNESWTITVDANDWLTIDQINGKGNAEIKVKAKPNASGKENNLVLTVQTVNDANYIIKLNVKQTYEAINILDHVSDPLFKKYLIDEVFEGKTFVSQADAAKITFLEVSGSDNEKGNIVSLEGIHFFKGLRELYCEYNDISFIDLSANTNIIQIDCRNNKLTSLDISKNIKLTLLICSDNGLTSLNISQNRELQMLSCNNNKFTTLDLSKNKELTNLCFSDNKLTSLDVSKNKKLANLWCDNNNLTSLDISNNTKLVSLDCSDNPLVSIEKSVKISNTTYNSIKDEDIKPNKVSDIYDVVK